MFNKKNDVLDAVLKENKRLRKENIELKKKVDRLDGVYEEYSVLVDKLKDCRDRYKKQLSILKEIEESYKKELEKLQ